jgi:hypothetical protein
MDHINILKRSGEILWRYRALWIFGIILALTTFSWETALWSRQGESQIQDQEGITINIGDDFSIKLPGEGLVIDITEADGLSAKIKSNGTWTQVTGLNQLFAELVPPDIARWILAIVIGLAVTVFLLYVLGKGAHYVAETALIRMVSDYENTGGRLSFSQGLRLGWSRTAWRLFLIDLLVALPVALGLVLLFGLVLSPLLLWTTRDTLAGIIGTITSAGLFFPFLAVVILVSLLVSLLLRFFHRSCAIENLGVIASIRHGFEVVRNHLKDVGVMWLIMLSLGFAWSIAMIPIALLLAPLFLILILTGGVIAGIPAVLVAALAGLFVEGFIPWILGALVALPIFVLIVASPMIFLGGLWHAYRSTSWTVTYQELRGLEVAKPESVPDLAPSTA